MKETYHLYSLRRDGLTNGRRHEISFPTDHEFAEDVERILNATDSDNVWEARKDQQ